MLKRFGFILAAVLMLIAGSAMATNTRVLTMGENNNILMDEANIEIWPQTLLMYGGRGLIEITDSTITNCAGFLKFGDVTMGGAFSNGGLVPRYAPMGAFGMGARGLDQKITLFFARNLSGMPFGLGLSLYGESDIRDAPGDQRSETGLGLKLNAGITVMETIEAFASLGMVNWELKNSAGNVTADVDGGVTISLGGRWWREMSERYTLIPHAMLMIDSQGDKTGGRNMNAMIIDLGIGNNIRLGDNVLMVHDLGTMIDIGSLESGGASKDTLLWYLPYFKMGFEAPVSKHFVFRCGGLKEWVIVGEDANGASHAKSYVNTRFYIGAGYTRDRFVFDANVDPGFFTRGPYLLTGAGNSMAMSVSLRYIWGD